MIRSARAVVLEPAALASAPIRDLGAARIARWLLTGPAQQLDGDHAGAVAGWIGKAGRADYVYPEITGYYLQWLAWMTRRHGRQPAHVARAQAALRWLARWLADEEPLTRIYVDTPRDDWRNEALFTFDLAMVLRGVGASVRAGLIEPSHAVVDRICATLAKLIEPDGQLDACIRLRSRADFPDRWSTRRGPFLAKAAAGILDAGEVLPAITPALRAAAKRTLDASLDALLRAPHDETHPFLYAVEGFLSRPDDEAFADRLPGIVVLFDARLARVQETGHVAETLSSDGASRLDIVAQMLRAGLLLDVHRRDGVSRRAALDRLADLLAQYVRADGALPFSPDVAAVQFNVWTAMFAEQALALAYREPREIARIAASPSIV